MSEVIVDIEAKDFAIDVFHLNQNGTLVGTQKVRTYNMRDTYLHNEGKIRSYPDGRIYICLTSNTSKPILVEFLPNLIMPDQESFPTANEAGSLERELFVTNSKIMELLNQHKEFEDNEQQGIEANFRIESRLKRVMFIQLSVMIVIAFVQYLVIRSFANMLKKL